MRVQPPVASCRQHPSRSAGFGPRPVLSGARRARTTACGRHGSPAEARPIVIAPKPPGGDVVPAAAAAAAAAATPGRHERSRRASLPTRAAGRARRGVPAGCRSSRRCWRWRRRCGWRRRVTSQRCCVRPAALVSASAALVVEPGGVNATKDAGPLRSATSGVHAGLEQRACAGDCKPAARPSPPTRTAPPGWHPAGGGGAGGAHLPLRPHPGAGGRRLLPLRPRLRKPGGEAAGRLPAAGGAAGAC